MTKEDTGDAYKILIRPIITEKITGLSVYNQYGFVVPTSTNKIEVKKAIEQVYGVKPTKVRMISVKGKSVRTGKVTGRTNNWKKAIITLKQGDKIEVYETVKS
ncbi:MAG: 50S ribosomal protein L23 [Patescibacteria group bacterium]